MVAHVNSDLGAELAALPNADGERQMHKLKRVIVLLFAAWLLAACDPFGRDDKYFLGEIEFEINGETVRHARAWTCQKRTIVDPSVSGLLRQAYRQVPTPSSSFVVKRFGAGQAVLFDNWSACGFERRRAGDWTEVTVFDSVAAPSYAERLYLKPDGPVTIHNPFESRFRVRLVKEGVTEIDQRRYKASAASSSGEGADDLYQLRLKAAFGLTVNVVVWNDTNQTGLRDGVPLNQGVWEVEKLRPPAVRKVMPYGNEHLVHNSSMVLLPLGYHTADGKRGYPKGMQVKYAGKTITLGDGGSASIEQPEPGVRRAQFSAELSHHVWSARCIAVPTPECPKLPAEAQ